MPVVYLPHGGGPWPFVEVGFGGKEGFEELAAYLRSVGEVPKTRPAALLVISAHWEEPVPTVMTAARPPMLYDYFGFPEAAYHLDWPAAGDPALAGRVRSLLEKAGFETAADPKRGFDHGTFVPLMLAYPKAEVPALQLSLVRSLDPAEHLRLGRALAPLRNEGVFIVGSGMPYHNLRTLGDPRALATSGQFDAWLHEACVQPPAERDARLTAWSKAPAARLAHPREEHLLPLMVVAGAAGQDRGAVAYSGVYGGWQLSGYQFGA